MSDHIVFARPQVISEERMNAAREKQMKQRALREALDKQIEQSRKLRLAPGDARLKTLSKREAIEQRYTFDFEDGRGRFVKQTDDVNDSVNRPTVVPLMDNRKAARGGSPPPRSTYQTNSLPPNFSMNTSEGNPLAPRTEYNTNSLPTGFVLGNSKTSGTPSRITAQRVQDSPTSLSPQGNHPPNGSLGEVENISNCVVRNFHFDDVKGQTPRRAQKSKSPPAVAQRAAMSSDKGQSNGSGRRGSSRSPRRPNGLLPPLEPVDGTPGKRTVDVPSSSIKPVELTIQELDVTSRQGCANPRSTKSKSMMGQGTRSGEAQSRPLPCPMHQRSSHSRVAESKMERLQKELVTRDLQMAKMREKEKNWEEQVKQLKNELKNAKKKERDLTKLMKGECRRAETAPDQPTVSPPVLNTPSVTSKRTLGPLGGAAQGKKFDFNKSRIFSHSSFRPISAPSEAVGPSYAGEITTVSPPLQDSFKCASLLTRQTVFGLREQHARRPVPIEYEHLLQFAEEEIITQQQADALWRLFTNVESPLTLLRRHPQGMRSTAESSSVHRNSSSDEEGAARVNELRPMKEKCEVDKATPERLKEKAVQLKAEDDNLGDAECMREMGEVGFKAHNDVYEEKSSPDSDTYETFAELHLQECLSQEESETFE
ncbi:hypothetical protein TRVL_00644 [Trypanosoma vivax]|uniref:Uncharacterized protein n=1 Tax=Trypanosoma vivax (strain Y486) TaxID=1055687 RepID=G0TX65_TRYVY|nr:hypothetical protein TRVL_00644 [Trypanosoma vivax]CCC48555.1 conserved hypothetical protein [Trypanosoma vivax Y486]